MKEQTILAKMAAGRPIVVIRFARTRSVLSRSEPFAQGISIQPKQHHSTAACGCVACARERFFLGARTTRRDDSGRPTMGGWGVASLRNDGKRAGNPHDLRIIPKIRGHPWDTRIAMTQYRRPIDPEVDHAIRVRFIVAKAS